MTHDVLLAIGYNVARFHCAEQSLEAGAGEMMWQNMAHYGTQIGFSSGRGTSEAIFSAWLQMAN